MVSDAVVKVHHLSYEYPGVRALHDVSFSVSRGSVTALVGPNGAGKSTLLRCMAALDQPLDGDIEIDGIDVLEEPRECHRRIGYLSDFFGLYRSLTVRQCLAYAAHSQGLAAAEVDHAVLRTAERLGLGPKLAASTSELSRGQRQRVAIGQALIHAPGLLILDEPASGLDPEARHELAALFKHLSGSGMTLIVSSHILAELDEYSTHMLVLRGGRIVESRALDSGFKGTGRVHVRAVFAAASARSTIDRAIERTAEVRLINATADEATFEVSAEPAAHAALLHALITNGLPVASFAGERENLHQSYLRTLASDARVVDPGGRLP